MEAIFTEQYAAGTNAPTGTASSSNVRVFNTTVVNQIPGCTLDDTTGYITVGIGEYEIEASANSFGYLASQISLTSVNGTTFNADGMPASGTTGQGAQAYLQSAVIGYLRADVSTTFKASNFVGATIFGVQSLGNDSGSGRPNVAAIIKITKHK